MKQGKFLNVSFSFRYFVESLSTKKETEIINFFNLTICVFLINHIC